MGAILIEWNSTVYMLRADNAQIHKTDCRAPCFGKTQLDTEAESLF